MAWTPGYENLRLHAFFSEQEALFALIGRHSTVEEKFL